MPQPGRDIRLTLFIKFSLLFLLWFFCIKGMKHPTLPTEQWLLGTGKQVQTQDALVTGNKKKLV